MGPEGQTPPKGTALAELDLEPAGSMFLVPRVGTSGNAGEFVEPLSDALRVGLFAALPDQRRASLQARSVAEAAMARTLQEPISDDDALILEEVAVEVDIALRHEFSPVDPSGSGTLVLAKVDHRSPLFGWTKHGAAYLVRESKMVDSLEGAGKTGARVDAQVGGRPRDASEAEIHVSRPGWLLERFDRIILATRHLSEWFAEDELAELVQQGSAEGAAQTLAALANVRSGGSEVAVAVFEISVNDASAELDGTSNDFADLLDTLGQLLPEMAAKEAEALEARHRDDGSAPTDGFAPIRRRFPGREDITLVPEEQGHDQDSFSEEVDEEDDGPTEQVSGSKGTSTRSKSEEFPLTRVYLLVGALSLLMLGVIFTLFLQL